MELNKGLNLDLNPINLPTGSWIKAKNVIRQPGKGVELHKGFEDVTNNSGYPTVGNIVGKIEIEAVTVLFYYDVTGFRICTFDETNGIKLVCTTPETEYLNINDTSRFTGTYTFNYKGDIIISFFDYINKGKPFILNITDLPFALGAGEVILPKTGSTLHRTLELLYLQPEYQTPNITIKDSNNVGRLKCGIYQFCIAYEISDFDFTNPSLKSEPFLVGKFTYETTSISIPNNDGSWNTTQEPYNIGLVSSYGSITDKSISLTISNLDKTFKRFKVISLFKTGESYEAETIGIYYIPDTRTIDINITGSSLYYEDYNNIILGSARFKGINTMTTFENKLSLLGVDYIDDEVWTDEIGKITYQVYANNIKLNVHVNEITNSLDDKIGLDDTGNKNVFKPQFPYDIAESKTFQFEEVYSLFIAFGKGDKISKAYHIPGRAATTITYSNTLNNDSITINENININSTEFANLLSAHPTVVDDNIDLQISDWEYELDDVVLFSNIRDTSKLSTNTLGCWNNTDEIYSSIFNTRTNSLDNCKIYDETGYTGESIATQRVRHHKMPSLESSIAYLGIDHSKVKISLSFDISSLYIPDSVKTTYDTVYLLSADKVISESLILGYSPSLSDRTGYNVRDFVFTDELKSLSNNNRFYDSFLNAVKPAINPTSFKIVNVGEHKGKPVTKLFTLGGTFHNINSIDTPIILTGVTNNIKIGLHYKILSYNYLEEGDTSKTPKNVIDYIDSDSAISIENREPILSINHNYENAVSNSFVEYTFFSTGGTSQYYSLNSGTIHLSGDGTFIRSAFSSVSSDNQDLFIIVLKSYKANVHLNFATDNLLNRQCTGLLLIDDIINDTVSTNLRFKGDCFINDETFKTKIAAPINSMSLYQTGTVVSNVIYTFTNYSKIQSNFITTQTVLNNQVYDYNPVFSEDNSLDLFTPSNLEFTNVTEIKTRFTRSVVLGTEAKEIGWRKFIATEYFDFPSDAGTATYLHGGDRSLLFGFDKDIYIAEIKETLDTGGGQTLALKTNNLFDTSPVRLQDTFERSLHIANYDNIFITKYGFVFYDSYNENIYLFDGKSAPLAISKLGINEYVKSLTINKIAGLYDEDTDHLFFTIYSTTGDHTFSYYLTEKQLVSKYDFALTNYFTNKQKSYGWLIGKGNDKIYKFNTSNAYCTYNTDTQVAYIDVLFNDISNLSKTLEAVLFNTLVKDGGTAQWEKTINNILIYTDFQAACNGDFTKYLDYVNGNYHVTRIKDMKYDKNGNLFIPGTWNVNSAKLAEYPIPYGSSLIIGRKYYVLQGSITHNGISYTEGKYFTALTNIPVTYNVPNTIIYSIKNKFEKSNIICKFAVLRFVLNDISTPNLQVMLNDVLVNYSKSI